MNKAFLTVRLIMLGIFALIVIAIWSYQFLYVVPKEKCERAGGWWAVRWRACGMPLPVTVWTGRPIPKPAEPGDPPPVTVPAQAQPAAK